MSAPASTRLDLRMLADRLVGSRARARDLILRGFVMVDGVPCTKPAQTVAAGASVTLATGTPEFVSRGAEKLQAALEAFGFDPSGRVAMDAGASTGGFTQVLLKRGAKHVYAVDVGRAQLHDGLRSDARVTSIEEFDIRQISASHVGAPIEVLVADLSFISLTKALDAAMKLASRGAFLVALIKPQFELTPADIGKGGIVRDETARARAVENVRAFVEQQPGWRVCGVVVSPIAGGSGNEEFLLGAVKDV
ncbi:MAG: TlyA family RNA methyltransferase [Hyphomicrobiaceae bacterium]|nr:TlyA family RNA methyltransferase [Hyphomicrobiaceae bacterium]